uniref:Glycosyltransferase 2-like domain-containing protein n=1 Tax=Pseudo-nitzschia multistriata TaxID=183589 RepID=A0A448ZAY1_9STRA
MPRPMSSSVVFFVSFFFSIGLLANVFCEDIDPQDLSPSINPDSGRSRSLASLQAIATSSPNFRARRLHYPVTDPHVCLAFLSCCQRTDLLNHTIAGAIRHMEEDEPSFLRYEIAWVDNGNTAEDTKYIKESYPIEHALTLPKNMGLAYGMNLLVNNLCKAPYILLLEEDWLYLDEIVANQTEERKRSIATSIALLENLKKNNVTAYDERNVIGVFLRHETYDSFLTFPHADIWERRENVSLSQILAPPVTSDRCSSNITETDLISDDHNQGNDDDDGTVDIDYRIFCADVGAKAGAIWGSYTNGAGLYRRSDLQKVGRQFGEPGDAFHDRYVEANYAFRVALKNCHAALRLTKNESCNAIYDPECTGAFHHIGGGRGTRPRTAKGTKCMDIAWNFFGTPLYEKFHKFAAQTTGETTQKCSRKELQELRDQQFRETDSESYREEVRIQNKKVFQKEEERRQSLRDQAELILNMLAKGQANDLRGAVPWMDGMSNEEIAEKARSFEKLANSPHPMDGFWDLLGRVQHAD